MPPTQSDPMMPGVTALARCTNLIGSWLAQRPKSQGGADRLKDDFLASVCHELRNPIGGIRNAVRVLRKHDGQKTTVQHHMHELIERQAGQMVFLVSGLLDITRIVRGQLTLAARARRSARHSERRCGHGGMGPQSARPPVLADSAASQCLAAGGRRQT